MILFRIMVLIFTHSGPLPGYWQLYFLVCCIVLYCVFILNAISPQGWTRQTRCFPYRNLPSNLDFDLEQMTIKSELLVFKMHI